MTDLSVVGLVHKLRHQCGGAPVHQQDRVVSRIVVHGLRTPAVTDIMTKLQYTGTDEHPTHRRHSTRHSPSRSTSA